MGVLTETGVCRCTLKPENIKGLEDVTEESFYKYEQYSAGSALDIVRFYRVYMEDKSETMDVLFFEKYFTRTGEVMLSPQEEFEKNMKDEKFAEWYKVRPEIIRNMVRKYPYLWYRIKAGAPYGISVPGTIVRLNSYTESGMVSVIVLHKHKLPAAIEHELMLCAKHNRDPIEVLGKDIMVYIDPDYLVPFFKYPR